MGSRWFANVQVLTELFKTDNCAHLHILKQIVYKHRRIKTDAVYAELFMTVKTHTHTHTDAQIINTSPTNLSINVENTQLNTLWIDTNN